MRKLRWGIVGAGRIANTFAADIRHTSNAELLAVAARDGADARSFAERHRIPHAYGGYQSLFNDDSVDAVYIATPHTMHLSHTLDALDAGKAVLCEKPLATTVEECRRMMKASERHEIYLMEGMWTWFLPAVQRALSWFREGRIGSLQHIRADFGFRADPNPDSRLFNPALGGGCLLDIGIYPLALARLFAADGPRSVSAKAQFAPSGVEDELTMHLYYPQHSADLMVSFRSDLSNAAVIEGSRARIEIPLFWRATECRLISDDSVLEVFRDERAGSGFEYQIQSASADVLAGCRESGVVPQAASLALQEDMARVRGECDSVSPRSAADER